jgi:hypothetical protein
LFTKISGSVRPAALNAENIPADRPLAAVEVAITPDGAALAWAVVSSGDAVRRNSNLTAGSRLLGRNSLPSRRFAAT